MKVSQAIHSYQEYHRFNSKKNTLKNYDFLFTHFTDEFGERELDTITPDEILSFLTRLTEGTKQTTKRNRYSSLKAFFNYVKNSIDLEMHNPCDTPILRKVFRDRRPQQWKIVEKDLIDEIIFKIEKPRNRIFFCSFSANRLLKRIFSIDPLVHHFTICDMSCANGTKFSFGLFHQHSRNRSLAILISAFSSCTAYLFKRC